MKDLKLEKNHLYVSKTETHDANSAVMSLSGETDQLQNTIVFPSLKQKETNRDV